MTKYLTLLSSKSQKDEVVETELPKLNLFKTVERLERMRFVQSASGLTRLLSFTPLKFRQLCLPALLVFSELKSESVQLSKTLGASCFKWLPLPQLKWSAVSPAIPVPLDGFNGSG